LTLYVDTSVVYYQSASTARAPLEIKLDFLSLQFDVAIIVISLNLERPTKLFLDYYLFFRWNSKFNGP